MNRKEYKISIDHNILTNEDAKFLKNIAVKHQSYAFAACMRLFEKDTSVHYINPSYQKESIIMLTK